MKSPARLRHGSWTSTGSARGACALCIVAIAAAPVHAQAPLALDPVANPPSTPASAAAPATPSPAASAPAPARAPEVQEARFDILEYIVEGNTVLPVPDIERAVRPFMGPKRGIKDVEAARKALEDTYQRLGYQTVFVDVPEQQIDGGVVTLRVLEGKVERLRVTGSRYFSLNDVKSGAGELKEGKVPNFNALQGQLANLNRTADRQVSPVLRPGITPGTIEVEMAVKDDLPLHGELELNNRSSAFTSESRLVGSLRWDNLWQKQHSAGLTVQLSPEKSDEVRVLVGNYLWRFDEGNNALALYAVKSNSRVAVVGSATVVGDATIAGARYVMPLTSSTGAYHSITLGADYKRFGETNIAADSQEANVQPELDYVPLSLSYSLTFNQPGRTQQATATVTSAPTGLFGNSDPEFQARRYWSRAGWTHVKVEGTVEQSLGEQSSLWAKGEVHWADEPLISNEQFTLGGAESVRGYRESELALDRGARVSLELRWSPWKATAEATRQRAQAQGQSGSAVPPSAAAGAFSLDKLQLYALLDGGAGWTLHPEGSQAAKRWIGGAGVGARWAGPHWRAQLEAARALNAGGSGSQGLITERGDWRVHVKFVADF